MAAVLWEYIGRNDTGMRRYVLRKAEAGDAALLFRWVNDPEARKNSFHTESVLWEEHEKWFKEKMEKDTCKIYILLCDGKEAGQIRIDIVQDRGKISYFVAPEYRGQGLGTKLLFLLEEKCQFIHVLYGEVKRENVASCRSFERNGYIRQETGNVITYQKVLKD